ncbi:protein BPS1, chloroplastic-like [Primulina tabacum]|uniref:protein BPS1, chloroplastic-like n=1 Tax=Primulina tabacum TaxID=48773 RepID=UPI003F5AC413
MQCAIKSLFEIHTDVKALIAALELPIHHCDRMWTDVYFDTSNKLLEFCTVLNHHIAQLQDGLFFLKCAVVELNSGSFVEARTSLDDWKQRVDAKNSRVDKCFSALDHLAQLPDRPNIKHSAKEKVLRQAIYGVKVATLFLASIFDASFSGSEKKLMDIQVPETYLWAENFTKLQSFMNTELRNIFSRGKVTVVSEREAVDASVEKLFLDLQNGVDSVETEVLQKLKLEFEKSSENFALGLDILAKELNDLFKDVIRGRNDLLDDVRIAFNFMDRSPVNENIGQLVR